MFVTKDRTQEAAKAFVEKLKSTKIEDCRCNKDTFNECLALGNFKRFIGSASCAMVYRRSSR